MEGPTKAPMRLCARASGDEPPCVLARLLKGDTVVDLLGLRHDVLGEADRLRANLCPWDSDEVDVEGEAAMHCQRVAILAGDVAERLDQEIVFLAREVCPFGGHATKPIGPSPASMIR